MSDIVFIFFVGSTKIGEISDISKCFENFISQALGVLTRIYAAELRFHINLSIILIPPTGIIMKIWRLRI